jgi:hypothetical protein
MGAAVRARGRSTCSVQSFPPFASWSWARSSLRSLPAQRSRVQSVAVRSRWARCGQLFISMVGPMKHQPPSVARHPQKTVCIPQCSAAGFR